MLTTSSLRHGLMAVALAGLTAGVAAAQIITPGLPTPPPNDYCTSGPFSHTTGAVKVHVALDDIKSGPAARVVIRLYDETGDVVASRARTIAAGHTLTLDYMGAGRPELLRAQAEVTDVRRTSSVRRRAVGQVERDIDGFTIPIDFECGPGETAGGGR